MKKNKKSLDTISGLLIGGFLLEEELLRQYQLKLQKIKKVRKNKGSL